jgi:His-Xaa-Ser system protein HxsD
MDSNQDNPERVRNMLLSQKDRCLTLKIDPRIFSLETVFEAAYTLMDRAHIIITGNPRTELRVELTLKDDSGLELLGDEFNNELLNYAVYNILSKKTFELRKMILARALIGNMPVDSDEPSSKDAPESCSCESAEEDHLADPLGIRKIWTEEAAQAPAAAENPLLDEEIEIPWLSPASPSQDPGYTSLTVEESTVKANVNLEIYPLTTVLLAAEEFRELCWVSLSRKASSIEVTLKPKDKETDLEELGKEFLTYIISVYKDGNKQEG